MPFLSTPLNVIDLRENSTSTSSSSRLITTQSQKSMAQLYAYPSNDEQMYVEQMETDISFKYTIDLTGMRVEDARVQVENEQTLILSNGKQRRRVTLPDSVRKESISATFQGGFLTITIPKI